MKNRPTLIINGLVLVAILAMTACGEESDLPEAKTHRVNFSYILPENPDHLHMYTLLKEDRRVLEKLQALLSPFRLPWTLDIVMSECGGEADAMYWDGTITICYEYLDVLWDNMPTETTDTGIEPIDAVVGPFVDTVFHEFAHALFDYLDIPVLGREEDAADQVSAYIYLQFGPAEARRLIMGTAHAYITEAKNAPPLSQEDFADEHSTPEQRRFNLLCIAYGAEPELFADIVVWGGLPQYRVDNCREEYELIALAYNDLIAPHVDPELAEKVFDRSWLPEETSRMLNRNKSRH